MYIVLYLQGNGTMVQQHKGVMEFLKFPSQERAER
jgi:hypothetical protein